MLQEQRRAASTSGGAGSLPAGPRHGAALTHTALRHSGSSGEARCGPAAVNPTETQLQARFVLSPTRCLSAGRARQDAAASRRSMVHLRAHRPAAPRGGTPAPDMDGAAGSSARPQPLQQQPNQAPYVAENRWKPQQEEMQWCRESGQELADVAAPPQHTQSQGATHGCHITPSTHTSTRWVEAPAPRPQGRWSAPPLLPQCTDPVGPLPDPPRPIPSSWHCTLLTGRRGAWSGR